MVDLFLLCFINKIVPVIIISINKIVVIVRYMYTFEFLVSVFVIIVSFVRCVWFLVLFVVLSVGVLFAII